MYKRSLLFFTVVLCCFWSLNSCTKDKVVTVTRTDTVRGYPVRMGPIRPTTAGSNAYIMQFFEYVPAPGQFLNTSLSTDSNARSLVGNEQGLLTLGGWGGYVVYGFDHTVIDTAGPDLVVIGNPLPNFAEPGVVWVMQDQNGNGKPDDTWFELAGSATGRPGYIRNYSVTYYRPNPANGNVPWKDSKGDSGYVLTNIFNTQDYYPDGKAASSYTLKGTLLPSVNIDTTDPTYVTSMPFNYGYCDNTVGGDYVDIATAIDSTGQRVYLKGIDFIKVQTGILFNMGWLGEQSTEVAGIADASLYRK